MTERQGPGRETADRPPRDTADRPPRETADRPPRDTTDRRAEAFRLTSLTSRAG